MSKQVKQRVVSNHENLLGTTDRIPSCLTDLKIEESLIINSWRNVVIAHDDVGQDTADSQGSCRIGWELSNADEE
jgi:hypothetical protein